MVHRARTHISTPKAMCYGMFARLPTRFSQPLCMNIHFQDQQCSRRNFKKQGVLRLQKATTYKKNQGVNPFGTPPFQKVLKFPSSAERLCRSHASQCKRKPHPTWHMDRPHDTFGTHSKALGKNTTINPPFWWYMPRSVELHQFG